MRRVTDDERRRRLAVRHLLAPSMRVDTVEAAAEAVVALHSSDPASVYLSACLRVVDGSLDDVERALYEERTLIRHHAMRRTLWVMTPAVAQAANAGFTRKIARAERPRTAKLFGRNQAWLDDAIERVVAAVEAAPAPIGTREVAQAVPDLAEPIVVNAGKRYEGTMAAHTRALLHAAFEGRIVRARPAGSWIGSQYAWVANDDWLAIDWSQPDELTGAIEIVRRWLDRFGPGTLDDIVWWTGSTKGLIGRALAELDTVEVELDGGETGLLLADDLESAPDVGPWVALLPALDPTPMGWKRRDWYLDPTLDVTDRNGNIGPTTWADGRAVGGWVQRPGGGIAHEADGLVGAHRRLLDAEIGRVDELIGATGFRVRFPAPNQHRLLG